LEKRARDECFGLPHGGTIFGLIIGSIIVLSGIIFLLQETGVIVEGFDVMWPFIIIVFGVLIVAGAIYGMTRR
jgi:hypothetical protein